MLFQTLLYNTAIKSKFFVITGAAFRKTFRIPTHTHHIFPGVRSGKEKSTLPMLKLPFVDTVKLDKSLIDCIGDRKGEIMLRQVVRLCYELGLYTTAEGVEAEDQVDFLRALDCTDIQGYFFSPPLPVEKYTEKLRQQARKRA